MSETLMLSTETEQNLLPAETDSADYAVEAQPTTPEAAAKPTALNRLANFFLKLAAKTEAADASFNNFKAETKENIESAKEQARETLVHVGSVALGAVETAGYITVGLGVMGVEAAVNGAVAAKNGIVNAGETVVGLGIMGKEAAVAGAKSAFEFTANTILDAKEGIAKGASAVKNGAVEAGRTAVGLGIMGKEAAVAGAKSAYEFTANKVLDTKEAINNLRESFIQKAEAAKVRKQERKIAKAEQAYNEKQALIQKAEANRIQKENEQSYREAAKAEQIKLAEQYAADKAGQKAAEMFAKSERAAIATQLKAERKQQYHELYKQTAEHAGSTLKSAREIGRLAIAAKKADKERMAL